MPAKALKKFLDSHNIKYVSIAHSTAYTAQEIAASAHVPGKEMAKTVMVRLDGTMAMAVLAASDKVDFGLLKTAAGARQAELASELEFKDIFPGCEIGAMPPFGNLYDMNVYAEKRLAEDEEIVFNAGSHTELVRLPYADFVRLVQPKTAAFAIEL